MIACGTAATNPCNVSIPYRSPKFVSTSLASAATRTKSQCPKNTSRSPGCSGCNRTPADQACGDCVVQGRVVMQAAIDGCTPHIFHQKHRADSPPRRFCTEQVVHAKRSGNRYTEI